MNVAEALDLWFENLQNYEATLVCWTLTRNPTLTVYTGGYGCCLPGCKFQRRTHCHRAMCDFFLVFPGDSSFFFSFCILTSGFKVLSEAERTAALYSLLQHSTQVQIRFFITVLQQMARSDPMTALLSPAMGGT